MSGLVRSVKVTLFVLFCIVKSVTSEEQETTVNSGTGVKATLELHYAILVIVGFGAFSIAVAVVFHYVRKHIFHDADNVDTAFDAGGGVSIGLTATTIVSQWTWSATLLQSATVASKYGISGPFWYGAGATIQIILFAILSIQLKTKAPGAKTFLQVIRARFGKSTHIIYCVFAGFTNVVVSMSLLLAGTAVITSLVQNLTLELACMILAAVIGSYTMIGGLGATFYVSYFNTALIFCMLILLVVEVFYNPADRPTNPLGSADKVYMYVNQSRGPDGNEQNSYLTFLSSGGLMFGIINIIGNFGTVFCDQSYWQSSIAAKPVQGVWGFIAGGLTWFAIPFTLATTMGLAYIALGTESGSSLLSSTDVDKGLVLPVVAQTLLGTVGEYVMVLLILMAIMSTGSAEVIAVAAIIVYDIYQIYINPFRRDMLDGHCVLCDKARSNLSEQQFLQQGDTITAMAKSMQGIVDLVHTLARKLKIDPDYICTCPPILDCEDCKIDNVRRKNSKVSIKPAYKCAFHGRYREYQDNLVGFKNWCILWVTLFTIPLVLLANAAGLNLEWVYLFTGVLIGCSVIPISLTLLWAGVNSYGMIAGVLIGCIGGFTSWLAVASSYEGGLTNFLQNTGKELPMLVGNCVSIGLGGLMCVLVSCCTRKCDDHTDHDEWEKTRNIENPLYPWSIKYALEFGIDTTASRLVRPTQQAMQKIFKNVRLVAIIVGISLTVGLIILWPIIMAFVVRVLNQQQFGHWTMFAQIWAFVAAAFIIIVPFVQEIYGIHAQIQRQERPRYSISVTAM